MLNPMTNAPGSATAAKLMSSLTGHGGAVERLVFSPDRRLLASAARDGTCRVWDIGSKPGERSQVRPSGEGIRSLAFSPNGRNLAVGSATGLISIVDLTSNPACELRILRGGQTSVNALAFSPDGKSIAGAGDDHTLRVWEIAGPGGEPRTVLPGHTRPITALLFSPDGQNVATAGRDGSVRVWGLNWIRASQKLSVALGGEVEAVAYSPDGKQLATAVPGKPVQVWEFVGGKAALKCEYLAPAGGVRALLIPDTETLNCVGATGEVLNFSLRTGRQRHNWELPPAPAACFALTTDGRYLARGRVDGTVELFRVAEKRKS